MFTTPHLWHSMPQVIHLVSIRCIVNKSVPLSVSGVTLCNMIVFSQTEILLCLVFKGFSLGKSICVFLFTYLYYHHSCALVDWFSTHGNKPDEETGMWVVKLDLGQRGIHRRRVISIDTIICSAHLILVYKDDFYLQILILITLIFSMFLWGTMLINLQIIMPTL